MSTENSSQDFIDGRPTGQAESTSIVDTDRKSKSSNLQTSAAAAAAAAAGDAQTRGKKTVQQSPASVKLDRIQAGVNQIIIMLAGRNEPHQQLKQHHASDDRTVAHWRQRSADLQDTVDALTARLESQAAELDAVQEEARRQRESAEAERRDLRRRLVSFRRQLDASQSARARLSAALTEAEAKLTSAGQRPTAAASNDFEETIEALTAQLDRSNEQLEVALLTRSCSCDQRLHQCCRLPDSSSRRQLQQQQNRSCDLGALSGASDFSTREEPTTSSGEASSRKLSKVKSRPAASGAQRQERSVKEKRKNKNESADLTKSDQD